MAETIESWDDDNVNLKQKLLRGIYGHGFENPSPIQKKAIIPMINRKDIIAQAQSGTGKTGAYSVSTLQIVDSTIAETQSLVLAPTRELAVQITDVIRNLSVQLGTVVKLLIGGTPVREDIQEMRNTVPHIVVGTPGRVFDIIRNGHIDSAKIKLLVLDEADEILSKGFEDQIHDIFQYLSSDAQIALFSATMPPELKNLTCKFMRDPVEILVKQEQVTLEGIKQFYIGLENDNTKFDTLKDIFSLISMSQCMIYCNSIKRVDHLYENMILEDYPVIKIHSGMSEAERRESHNDIKTGNARVIICTDLFARGIDIQQVSYVINFDVPSSVHTYIHRIGRSGRWGRKGVSINFVTKRDLFKIKEIEQYYNTQIEEMPMDFAKYAI